MWYFWSCCLFCIKPLQLVSFLFVWCYVWGFFFFILAAVPCAECCLNRIRKKGRRVGERCNILLPAQYFGPQWWVIWKSGERLIRGKRQNLRFQVLSMLEIRKSICRQKIREMVFGFLWVWGRSPRSDVHRTSMTSSPPLSVKAGPRPPEKQVLCKMGMLVPGRWVVWFFFPSLALIFITNKGEEIVFNAILFQNVKNLFFYLTCLLNKIYLWNCSESIISV